MTTEYIYYITPTQTIATPCCPVLPLLPLQGKVQSLAGLSTLYLSSACVVCLGDGALMVPSEQAAEQASFMHTDDMFEP